MSKDLAYARNTKSGSQDKDFKYILVLSREKLDFYSI